MNIQTLKTACWALTALLTLAFCYAVWLKIEREDERTVGPPGEQRQQSVDPDYLRQVLDTDSSLELDVKLGLDYGNQVQPAFITMNWTGYRAPKPVVKPREVTAPPKPRYRPIEEVLMVALIAVDSADPGGSRAFVKYLQSGVEDVLYVGDVLAKPNDYALVHAIHIDRVEFAFKQDGRANESVSPRTPDDSNLIVHVGEDGFRKPMKKAIPKVVRRSAQNLAETTRLGNNLYQLGTDDLDYFSTNYAEVLTNEVKTRTYYDENGRRSGIEIQSVKSGSTASRHGAQAGDVLISINGNPVSSEQEAIHYVKNNSDKYTVWEVEFERLGKRQTVVYKSPEN